MNTTFRLIVVFTSIITIILFVRTSIILLNTNINYSVKITYYTVDATQISNGFNESSYLEKRYNSLFTNKESTIILRAKLVNDFYNCEDDNKLEIDNENSNQDKQKLYSHSNSISIDNSMKVKNIKSEKIVVNDDEQVNNVKSQKYNNKNKLNSIKEQSSKYLKESLHIKKQENNENIDNNNKNKFKNSESNESNSMDISPKQVFDSFVEVQESQPYDKRQLTNVLIKSDSLSRKSKNNLYDIENVYESYQEDTHENSSNPIKENNIKHIEKKQLSTKVNPPSKVSIVSSQTNSKSSFLHQKNQSNQMNSNLSKLQTNNETLYSTDYKGLPKFSDDTLQIWNERVYAMQSFYHQYMNLSSETTYYKKIQTGRLNSDLFSNQDIVYITGSSSNHFLTSLAMLLHLLSQSFIVPIVYIDFGLSATERDVLIHFLNVILNVRQSMNNYSPIYYRQINWEENPEILREKTFRSIYALKAIATINIAEECKCKVFWLDAGDYVGNDFLSLSSYIDKDGLRSRRSRGPISSLTRKGTFIWFDSKIPTYNKQGIMCSSGFLSIDPNNEYVWNNIALMLRECLYRPKCIFPKDSTKQNHRYEQSALSILVNAYQLSRTCSYLDESYVRFQGEIILQKEGFSVYTNNLLNQIIKKYNLIQYEKEFLNVFHDIHT